MSGRCERKCYGLPSFCKACGDYTGCTYCTVKCKCDYAMEDKEKLKQYFAQNLYSHIHKKYSKQTLWTKDKLLSLISDFSKEQGIIVEKKWDDDRISDNEDNDF